MKSIFTFLLLAASLQAFNQSTTLKGGAIVNITVTENINSTGQTTPAFIVLHDVKDNDGRVVIESGALVDVDMVREEPTGLGRAMPSKRFSAPLAGRRRFCWRGFPAGCAGEIDGSPASRARLNARRIARARRVRPPWVPAAALAP